MLSLFTRHKIIAIIGVVVVVGALGWGLLGSSQPAPLLSVQDASAGADQELVSTLLQLRAVTLSGTIFSDPVFMSLKDFGRDIVPEPVGRPNPFAPLSLVAQPTSSTTRGAQIFKSDQGQSQVSGSRPR